MPAPKDPIKREEWIRKLCETHIGKGRLKGSKNRKPFTKDVLEKKSKRMKGNKLWLGRHHTDETKEQMSKSSHGPTPQAIEAARQWHLNNPVSRTTGIKISLANKGKPKPPFTEAHCLKLSLANKDKFGKKNPNWKGGISPLKDTIRGLSEYKNWCFSVLKRDCFKDIHTGDKGILNIHHHIPFHVIMEEYNIKSIEDAQRCQLLWDINNGVTLLEDHHNYLHNKYGYVVFNEEWYHDNTWRKVITTKHCVFGDEF